MKKLLSVLRSNRGSMSFFSVFIILSLLLLVAGIFEFYRLQIIAQGTSDAVQKAVTAACTENYGRLYNGVREGYSGGYRLEDDEWVQDIDSGSVYAKLDGILGTRDENTKHVKYTQDRAEFSLSDLSVQMTNTPFAPGDPENENMFTGIAELHLEVPLSFGWNALPPMQIHLKVTAGYMAKF